jgi:hypothetical protein
MEVDMLTTSVPVTVAPAAATFVDEAGLHAEFDRLLDHILQSVSGLRAIDVTFSPYCDEASEEMVRFNATVAVQSGEALEAEDEWMRWAMVNFPFEVTRRFILFANPETVDAR